MLEALHSLTSSCIKRVTIGLKKPYPHSQPISEKGNLLTRVFPFPPDEKDNFWTSIVSIIL